MLLKKIICDVCSPVNKHDIEAFEGLLEGKKIPLPEPINYN